MFGRTRTIALTCPWGDCGKASTVQVDAEAYRAWLAGFRIEDAFPELPPADRERIASGLCPAHAEVLFGVSADGGDR